MPKRAERLLLLALDFLTVNLAYYVYYLLRVRSGWFAYPIEPDLILPMLAIYVYWLMLFAFFGLYRSWYAQSRLDELVTLIRIVTAGVLVLFFLIFIDDESTSAQTGTRILIAAYWIVMVGFISIGRLALRAAQKRLLEAGIGARNTLIVGWSAKARELCDMVIKYPALGYKLVGFVDGAKSRVGKHTRRSEYKHIPVVGTLDQLSSLIRQHEVREVLVGLESSEHDKLIYIINECTGFEVGLRMMADLYDIVSGQARISSIYGVPLIEVTPEIMKPWEESLKRGVDIVVSFLILGIGLPFWLLVAVLIKLDSQGTALYRQERLGRNGRPFRIFKYRSMADDAEKKSGPVWASRKDPRVTRVGRIIRKLHIDEVPQFINVLLGEMSLVGPRPERSFFVEKLAAELPLYKRRLKVRPGITGWAQVKHKYDESIEDVKVKLKYDLFYIENMSWRMDLKILFNTFYVMIMGKGHT
ncbi:MAG TPA: sugar transferase [Bacteroidetes bacterium]|nr:MAG: exopolysaccharide biosynthesis polyprenyl glycosylphosphotransferase [Ignavibacteria bacterium GWA2_54_16]HCA81371.1 sugar transferase [Bacteroidota bacterium]